MLYYVDREHQRAHPQGPRLHRQADVPGILPCVGYLILCRLPYPVSVTLSSVGYLILCRLPYPVSVTLSCVGYLILCGRQAQTADETVAGKTVRKVGYLIRRKRVRLRLSITCTTQWPLSRIPIRISY